MLLKIKMSSSHLKATSHVGDSAVKARPKRETRDVELYTRTAVWEEDIIFGMLLPFTRQGINAPNNMEMKKPRV